MRSYTLMLFLAWLGIGDSALANQITLPANSAQNADLAMQLGADENGMRNYVMVILKTGEHRVPDGKIRDEMFQGHFANIKRLADEGKLVVAGPFGDKTNNWRGMFILAVDDIEEAKLLVATDPVIINGEMSAEYHSLYASAALMSVNNIHKQISPK
jgi:uncharacterized protein YciI